MTHLHIIAEGQTEEEFVRKVIAPHLADFEVYAVCQRVHTGGDKTHPTKGGFGKRQKKYHYFTRALERWIQSDKNRPDVYYSSMLDLYAFPMDDKSPYTEDIQSIQDKYTRIVELEKAMYEKHGIDTFIPYVQLHEFETFLLADPERLGVMYPDKKSSLRKLKQSLGQINIELINDKPTSAPSKRIINAVPEYEGQKSTIGPMVAEDIGIQVLKQKCQHFSEWVTKLENLNTT